MKLGLIGVGKWGKNYISTIDRMDGVSIGAVCRQNTQPPLGIPSDCAFFTDWHAMLDTIHRTNTCDGLIIATPPDSHVPIAIEAKRLGIPMMIEKPLALTAQEVKSLIDAEGSALFLVNHIHLFSRAYEALLDRITRPIIAIQSEGWGNGPSRNYSSLHDYGPHDLAMCIDIMGRIPDDARASRVITKYGEIFNLVLGWHGPHRTPAILRVGNGGESKRRLFQVFGNGVELEYDDTKPDKFCVNGEPVSIGQESPLELAIRAFVNSIRGVQDSRCGLKLAHGVARVIDFCQQSINR